MEYYQEAKLNSGKAYILRHPTGEDAQEILDHLRITCDETDYMLRYSDEVKMTVEEEDKFLSDIADSTDSIMIAAVVDGKIVANAGLSPISPLDKCKHRAEFGISIQREYWGQGIGSQIMQAILQAAKEMGYEQVELEVVTDNSRAIALYRKFGFEIYGTSDRAFRLRDGQYQAQHLMSRTL